MFAAGLGLLGFTMLYIYVNVLTAAVALVGFIAYVPFYTYAKRVSHWGVVVGSISGAMPITVGYTAVLGQLDLAAFVLFFTLVLWQMPHFYAIAIYRFDEYATAGIPTLPVKKVINASKLHIVFYILSFLFAASLLTIFGCATYVYFTIVLIIGLIWLGRAIRGFHTSDEVAWAHMLFKFSLTVVVTFSIALAIDPLMQLLFR